MHLVMVKKYHGGSDNYPEGNPAGLVLENLVKEFSNREILLTCYKLTNETEKMYEIMEKAYCEGIVLFCYALGFGPQKKLS